MTYFQYGEVELDFLKKKDKKLAKAIDEIGMIEREVTRNPFEALIKSIVGQQISLKAANTVWNRLNLLVGEITPKAFEHIHISDIQKCGMSERKAMYIKNVSHAAISGEIDFNSLHARTDEEVIQLLSSLKGVGEWTAEMMLIFSLCRPNIVSYKDLAIRRGMMNLYGLKELPKEIFDRYKNRYSPYGSVASLYLWELSKKESR